MTRRELNLCLAYMHIEPPERGADIRTATMMAHVANMAGKTLPEGKMAKPSDFLNTNQPIQSAEEQKSLLRSFERPNKGT